MGAAKTRPCWSPAERRAWEPCSQGSGAALTASHVAGRPACLDGAAADGAQSSHAGRGASTATWGPGPTSHSVALIQS